MNGQFSYMVIADSIYKDFIEYKLKAGDTIPGELELTQHYKVSRTTVRRAIKELIKNHILYSVQGSGTYVKEQATIHKITVLDSHGEYAQKIGKKPSTKVLEFSTILAGIEIAQLLNIKMGDMIYFVRRIRLLDDKPANYEISYMPVSLFPDLSISVMEISKYDYIEKTKRMTIKGSHAIFEAVILDEEKATYLEVRPRQPALCVKMQSFLDSGIIFEYTESIRNPENYAVALDIDRFAPKELPTI